MSQHSNQNTTSEDDSNAILHASLLRGTLTIKATEMDIRRSNESSSIFTSSIETDYILRIESSNRVKFDKDSVSKKMSVASIHIQDLETYHCSKRYVDLRNLANTMRGHAEAIVRYYELKKDTPGTPGVSSRKSSSRSTFTGTRKRSTVFATLEKAMLKPVEAMQYLTNTEPSSSNLVNELERVFSNSNSSDNDGGKSAGSGSSSRHKKVLKKQRTSETLDGGTPSFVRDVIVGVDEFYEAIYSEKRQFSKKTDYDYVKSVAERRKAVINIAFSRLMSAFSSADLASVRKRNAGDIPMPLEALVKSVEKFLVTDVVAEEGKKVGASGTAVPSTGSATPQETPEKESAEQEESISNSIVCPKSTRRRASVLDRELELKNIKKVAELALVESEPAEEEKLENAKHEVATTGGEVAGSSNKANTVMEVPGGVQGVEVQVVTETGILPEHPIDFGLVVLVGTLLFKWAEGRILEVQMDMLLMFGIACALIGYQMPHPPATVHVQKKRSSVIGRPSVARRTVSFPTDTSGSPHKPKAPQDVKEGSPERKDGQERPTLGRRSLLTKSNGSLDIKKDQRRQSLHLIQASMRHVKTGVGSQIGDREEIGAEEEPTLEEEKIAAPPAKTFPKFPDGAKIGSHLNCWSSPDSTNFHVRGPNYLKDKKKVPSGDYLFPCRGCDLFLTDNPPTNLGRNHSILNGKLRDVPTFIINYRLPWGVFLSYHEIPKQFLPFLRRGNGHGDMSAPLPSTADMTAGERAMCNFLLADSDEKNEVWKIVPIVVEGPWVVKKVVGGKPAIVGTKMPINYVYQPPEKGLCEYLEADLDIVSSAAARNILAVVRSYTQVLTIDLGYVVQGNKAEELPEQMMLGLRLHGLDPLTAELLPMFEDDATVMEESDYDSGNETE